MTGLSFETPSRRDYTGAAAEPSEPSPEGVVHRLTSRRIEFVTYADWQKLDALELAAGQRSGRPRVKFTSRDELAGALST